MKKEEIFKNIIEEISFQTWRLENNVKEIKETDVFAANGYALAIKDFREIIERVNKHKDFYIKGPKKERKIKWKKRVHIF